jgi:hypothetical protein
VLPTTAERALAPFSPSSYGICSIINRLTIDSIANPHLNDEPGTIITFLDEMFGLIATLNHNGCRMSEPMPQNPQSVKTIEK